MGRMQTELTNMLEIDYPIIQAPMAGGITSTTLVSESSNNGALGMVGAGYMTANELKQQIRDIKNETKKPFGVNVFVPAMTNSESAAEDYARHLLQPYYDTFQIDASTIEIANNTLFEKNYEQQIQVIMDEMVPVVSFTFGIPSQSIIKQFKNLGITTIGTAETVDEALTLERSGIDLVTMQGSEAGGHRGGFMQQKNDQGIGLMTLLPQAASSLSVPIIGSGGIMDGRGLVAALSLGAVGVQMGTAFLMTEESGAHPLHKQSIKSSKEQDAVITTAFSGKQARGIRNAFIDEMSDVEHTLPPYPIMNQLTQPIRKAAKENNNSTSMSLWSGQGTRLSQTKTVAKLLETTIRDAKNLMYQFGKDEQHDR